MLPGTVQIAQHYYCILDKCQILVIFGIKLLALIFRL